MLLARVLSPVAVLALTACAFACHPVDQGEVGEQDDAGAVYDDVAPTVPLEAVQRLPHDPAAYTQGLVLHAGTLYEGTGGRGASTLRRVELQTGKVLQADSLPAPFFGEGVAVLGDRIYQLTWQEHTGFIYDLATMKPLGSFSYAGEGWGLTTDGRHLIVSDGTNVLQFVDPATFTVARTLEVRDGEHAVHQLNELEWIRGEIWANVWHKDKIARIDPRSGRVLQWLDLSELLPPVRDRNSEAVANGIAFDERSGRIYVTGKLWPVLYEVRPAP